MQRKKLTVFICCLLVLCLVPAMAMAKSKTPARDWKLTVAQQKLEMLGYDVDRKDGRMSKDTGEAIKKFQKEHGLKKSGKLDNKTYNKISWEAFKMEGIPDVRGKDIVKTAAKYKGVPYKFGGTTPKGFDCSAYVQYVFGKHDAKLPRTADAGRDFCFKKQAETGRFGVLHHLCCRGVPCGDLRRQRQVLDGVLVTRGRA